MPEPKILRHQAQDRNAGDIFKDRRPFEFRVVEHAGRRTFDLQLGRVVRDPEDQLSVGRDRVPIAAVLLKAAGVDPGAVDHDDRRGDSERVFDGSGAFGRTGNESENRNEASHQQA